MAVFIIHNVSLLSIQIAAVLIRTATIIQISSGRLELLRERVYPYWKWRFEGISFLYFITKSLEDLVHLKGLNPTTISSPVPWAILAQGNVWHCFFLQIYSPYFTEFTESIYKTFHPILCGVCFCASRIFKEPGLWRPKTKTVLHSSKTSSVSVPRTFSSSVFANRNTYFLTKCLLLPARFLLPKNTTDIGMCGLR